MRRPLRPTLPANRRLFALVAADGVSRFGDWIYLVALPVLVWDRTHSELLVGLMTMGRLVPFLTLSMPAGVLADRVSRTAIVAVTESISCLAMLAAAVLSATPDGTAGVIVAAFVASTVGTISLPAFMSLMPEVARSDDELARANAARSTIDGLAGILGPALAAALIVVGGLPLTFLLNGLTFAAVVVTILALRVARPAPDAPTTLGAEPAPAPDDVRWPALVRSLAPQLCLDGAVSLSSAALAVLTVLLAAQVVGSGPAFAGPLGAAAGVGAIAGALLAGRSTGSRASTGSTLSVAVLVATLALLAVPGSPVVALLAMAGLTGALMLLDTLNVTAVQVTAGPAATGRAVGLLHTLAAVWMLVGTGIATAVSATAGAAAAVLAVAIATAALGITGLLLARLQSTGAVARRGVLVSSLEGSS